MMQKQKEEVVPKKWITYAYLKFVAPEILCLPIASPASVAQ
jgi:hypothetical protein